MFWTHENLRPRFKLPGQPLRFKRMTPWRQLWRSTQYISERRRIARELDFHNSRALQGFTAANKGVTDMRINCTCIREGNLINASPDKLTHRIAGLAEIVYREAGLAGLLRLVASHV